jgi:hypothetical protein
MSIKLDVREVNAPEVHHFFKFDEKPISGAITEVSTLLTNHFLKDIQKSMARWKTDNQTYTVTWPDNSGATQKSGQISYKVFSQKIRESGVYNHSDFNLPKIECYWLDNSVDVSINFHKFDKGGKEALTVKDGTPEKQFGTAYPIKPQLDREGHFFTTFQPHLIKKLIQRRTDLITNSHLATDPDWVMDLRYLINDIFSLVDITLNQFYIKAKYDPLDGWTFDESKVGRKNGRRLVDKLKWVHQITGKNLDYESERDSLRRLKDVRNHFNHFDPPSLVITLEETETWLNDVIVLGFLLIRIRKTINVTISDDLANLVIQKKAKFVPQAAFSERLPLDSKKNGYYSSQWETIPE